MTEKAEQAQPLRAGLITVIGSDARSWLHRLLTVNVKCIPINGESHAFLLSSTGKIQGAFSLKCLTDDCFWLSCALDKIDSAYDALDLYLFGESVKLSKAQCEQFTYQLEANVREQDNVQEVDIASFSKHLPTVLRTSSTSPKVDIENWSYAVQKIKPSRLSPCIHGDGWLVSFASNYTEVILTLIPSSLTPEIRTEIIESMNHHGLKRCSQNQMDWNRITRGEASLLCEYSIASSPLDIGENGISEGKGCYPGQEVIERTIALGQPSRALIMLKGSGTMTELVPLKLLDSNENEVGFLSSYISQNESIRGLGLIKRKALESTMFYTEFGKQLMAIEDEDEQRK